MTEERLGLDIRGWAAKPGEDEEQARQRIIRDFTYALTEQQEAPPEERNNPGKFLIDRDQKLLLDPDTGEPIINLLRSKTESDFLENEGFSRIQRMVFENNSGNWIWISPPSQKFGYTEARFIVYRIGHDEDGEVLLFDAGCGVQGERECLEIANDLLSLLPESSQILIANELRTRPIPFDPPRGIHWADYLAGFITPSARWEIIKRDEHRLRKQQRRLMAEQIVARHFEEIQNCSRYSSIEHLIIGSRMEEEARRYYGIRFQAYGSHGSSNTEALNKFKDGAFNTIYSQATGKNDSEQVSLCKKCHKQPAEADGFCSNCR
jgi:hypothetical protein